MEYRLITKDFDGRTHFQRVRDGLINRSASTDFKLTLVMFVSAALIGGAAIGWVM
jgi:hypothetical protein